ncbi:MAG: mechanosensitive ion channel family protein [bacterium]|nr:mechanosensitive ion channel family protein [bacterium]
MFNLWSNWVTGFGLGSTATQMITLTGEILIMLILCFATNFITRRIILVTLTRIIRRTKSTLDDAFLDRGVFTRLSHLAPGLVIYLVGPAAFVDTESMVSLCQRIGFAYLLLVLAMVASAFLNALVDIYRHTKVSRNRPIKGYMQVIKIVIYLAVGIAVLSALLGRSPVVMLSGLGAMTAVLMLIFKDSILGLVAGIQLAANDMLGLGDWIAMPKYGADGVVTDVTLTTIKVQNWDKTISTVPAYALISDAFVNWRGMEESGGRRIKRALNIDMNSIRFAGEDDLNRYRRWHLLADYIEGKEGEIVKWNVEHSVAADELFNGRRLTNIGTFRAYLEAYLRAHPLIHDEMTFLIRQLAPGEHGLPLEIYVFSRDQVWANYEALQADIFDHILAMISEFDLRVYQQPTGADFAALTAGATDGKPHGQ